MGISFDKEAMDREIISILILGLILVFGYMGGLLSNLIGLPKVSGYVFAGIILSPSVTGIISGEFLKSSSLAVDLALAIVAFDIGAHLNWTALKGHKKGIVLITLGQGAGAYILVALGMYIFSSFMLPDFSPKETLVLSVILAAVSLSTAPATTMAVVHEYRAKGPLTSMLIAVVSLDDAVGLIVFALSMVFIRNILHLSSDSFLFPIEAGLSLPVSILLGILTGLVLYRILKLNLKREAAIILSIAFLCLCYGTAKQLNLEPILATMAVGMIVANIFHGKQPFRSLEMGYEPVIMAIFFVLAGAHIDISLFIHYFPLAIVFACARISGKCIGTYMGGVISAMPKQISRYLGLGLAPQAGIAIGLSIYLQNIPGLEKYSAIVLNIILAKTALNEIIGPYLLKYALFRTGEAGKH
jgi:Kef-type K+ transport system membrane component KefB